MSKQSQTSPSRPPLITRLRSFDGKAFQSDANWGTSYGLGTGASETEELREPYRQEPWVYACIRRISDAAESATFKWYENEADEVPSSHPLAMLWSRPNAHDTEADLLSKIATYLCLSGECFLFLVDEKGNPVKSTGDGVADEIEMPAGIFAVLGGTRNVAEVFEDGRLVGWRVSTLSGVKTFSAAATIVLRYNDPARPHRGVGPLAAAYGIATQSYVATRFQNNLLRNGGEPSGVITMDAILKTSEYRRIQEEIDDHWNQPENAGGTRLLMGGAKYQKLQFTPQEMAFAELITANRLAMSTVFQVPSAVLGLQTENYATFRGQLQVFWTITIVPLLSKIARAINNHLVPRLRDKNLRKVKIEPDLGSVEALRGDLDTRAATAEKLVKIGVPLNAALLAAGLSLDEIEGGDVGLIASGLKPIANVAAEAGAENTADPALSLTGVQITGLVAIVEKVAQGLIPKQTGIELIVAAFPLDRDRATAILAEVEEGSVTPPSATPPGSGGSQDPPADGADPADGEDPPADDGKAVRGVGSTHGVTRSVLGTREARIERLRSIQSAVAPSEARLDRGVRRVFNRMRAAQLDLLRNLSGGAKASHGARCYASDPISGISRAGWSTLLRAVHSDASAEKRGDQTVELDCSGAVVDSYWSPGPAMREWLGARPRLDEIEPRRLRDLAVLQRAALTEAEIDSLVDALDKRWAAELEAVLAAAYEDAAKRADAQVLSELGPSFVSTPDPAAIKVLRAKAIQVAEGVQSTVAQRLRSALIDVFSESNAVGTLQDKILAEFEALSRETRRQFNMNARRARTIARTEVGQASSVVRTERLDEAADSGLIDQKRWITAVPREAAPPYEDGGSVRFQHWSMDGQVTSAKGSWTMPDGTILRAPKAPGGPAKQIINCRCDEAPEIDLEALV